MDGEGEGWRASTQTGLEGQVPGNSEQRATVSWGPLGKGAPLSGALVAREPLSWVCRTPWFGRETEESQELGNRREGSWPGH